MREARFLAPAEDFAIAVNNIGAAVGVTETRQLVDRALGDERADVRLAVAVRHPGKLRQRAESDGQDPRFVAIRLPRPVHRFVDGLLGERMPVLNGMGLPDTRPPAVSKIRGIWLYSTRFRCSYFRCTC